jgi:hypothetical protein
VPRPQDFNIPTSDAAVICRIIKWLSQAAWFKGWFSHGSATPPGSPHGGGLRQLQSHQVGNGNATPPHGGEHRVSPQENALSGIVRVWDERTTTQNREPPEYIPARELACRFRSCLQSEPALINWRIPRKWVQQHYPLFLQAMNVKPVAYKDFAKELAGVMPRKRLEGWSGGKRLWTHRYYLVQDPSTNVVEIAAAKRERAG